MGSEGKARTERVWKRVREQALAIVLALVLLFGTTGMNGAWAAVGAGFSEASGGYTLSYEVLTEDGGSGGTAKVTGCAPVMAGQASSLTIPATVTTTGSAITYGVTEIGGRAFANCPGLEALILESTSPPAISVDTFAESTVTAVYVPAAAATAYQTAWGTGWNGAVKGYDYRVTLSESMSGGPGYTVDDYYKEIQLTEDGMSYYITGSTAGYNLKVASGVAAIDLTLDNVRITAPLPSGALAKDALYLGEAQTVRLTTIGDVTLQGGTGGRYGGGYAIHDTYYDMGQPGGTLSLICGPGEVQFIGGADGGKGLFSRASSVTIAAGSPVFQAGEGTSGQGLAIDADGAGVVGTLIIGGDSHPRFRGPIGGAFVGNLEVRDNASADFSATVEGYGITVIESRITLATGGDVTFTGTEVDANGWRHERSGILHDRNGDLEISLAGLTGRVTATGANGISKNYGSLSITGTAGGSGAGLEAGSNAAASDSSGNGAGIWVNQGDLILDTDVPITARAVDEAFPLRAGSGKKVMLRRGSVTAENPADLTRVYTPALEQAAAAVLNDNGPPAVYTVAVTGGILARGSQFGLSTADCVERERVHILADPTSAGRTFQEWSITPAVTFVDGTSETDSYAVFIMPGGAVTATAGYGPAPGGGDDDDDDDGDSGGGSSGTVPSGPAPSGQVPASAITGGSDGVTVELKANATKVSAAQTAELIKANQEAPVTIRGSAYTLTFPQGTMEAVPGQTEYDFGLSLNAGPNHGRISALAGDAPVLTVSFNHSGPLPAEALITFEVGTACAGQTLYCYYYNEATGKLEYRQQAEVSADGTVSIRQSRCADYVFTAEKLSGESILDPLLRVSGGDRYQTAAEISRTFFGAGADTVILVRGDSPADALPAVPLAKQYNAPLLLTQPGALPEAVLEEIQALKAGKVILIGGPGAISAQVENTLKGHDLTVERISGASRYDTAYAIAKHLTGTAGRAVLVNGDQAETAFADALSVSAWAGYHGIPILYADSTAGGLPPATAQALDELAVKSTVLVGGTGAVPARLEALLPEPERYAGADRWATNAAVLKALQPEPEQVFLASGRDFADALAGAAAAARTNGWLILTGGPGTEQASGTLTAAQQELLQTRQGRIKEAGVFGGPAAVPEAALETVRRLLGW